MIEIMLRDYAKLHDALEILLEKDIVEEEEYYRTCGKMLEELMNELNTICPQDED